MRAASQAGLRPLHLAALIGLALAASVATVASAAPTFRATASMTPQVQYLNDTTGTVFTFTVINIGDTPFAAVDIARPSPSWVVKTCPLAPAGWTTERHVWGCRFRSRVTASDDIPGHSSNANFRVKATVRAGSDNLVGRWRVVVSRTRSFSLARDLRSAPPLTPGLRMVAHSFQVLDAVVVPSPLAIGSACPAPTAANHSAITGSTGHTVAICGRNRTTAARTPGAAFSSLGGTFVASHGGFASGSIRANSGNVVLGNWSNVTITSSAGAGKTIAAKIGSSAARTSPITTLSGYTATNEPPVAAAVSASTNEDTASGPITLSATDPNGDPITFSIASGPAHGTLGAISAAACPSTAPAAHTCTATVVYTPAVNYNGPDSFTYIATDTFAAASAPATVSLTVNQINDQPIVNPAGFTVFENRPNGTFIGLVTSSDADTGQTRTYSIQAGNTGGAFAIIGSTGAITVANSAAVDFETNPTFSLTIRATDNGSPPSFGEATVTVNLLNINDAPTLNAISDPAAIPEDSGAQNQSLGGISAGAGESQTLVVTAISSNTALIPNPTVTYTSPNATGSLAYTPVANQSGSAVITVTVGDNGGTANGGVNSFSRTFTVTVTPVNDDPVVTTTGSPLSYTEGDGAVAFDTGLTVTDVDDTNLQGVILRIGSNFVSDEDALAFVDQNGISGSYDHATGYLDLTGTASVATYQTALRSVTYANSSQDPSGSKTIDVQAYAGSGGASFIATRTINLTAVNDAPTVTTSAGSTAYTEGGAVVVIDGSVTVADPDDTNIESGQVRISSNFEAGDDLVFSDQNGISGVYNSGTGVLTLTGIASKADYQAALRSIEFRNLTSDNPAASKTVEFKVNDGDADSNAATKGIAVTAVNDGPTITSTVAPVAYTEGSGPVAVDSGLTLTDPEGDQVSGATVQISSGFDPAEDELALVNQPGITDVYDDITGTLTLSGTTTIANYQTALRLVTYENSATPPSTATRTVSFQATDNGTPNQASNTATRSITVATLNQAPTVTTSPGSIGYTENAAATIVDATLTVADIDDANLAGGQVRVSVGFDSGDSLAFVNALGISGSYDSGTGVLTLTGASSVANYQTALRSVTFSTTNDNPTPSKVVAFKVNDGTVDSAEATKDISVAGSNDGPSVATSSGDTTYTENAVASVIDGALTVADVDDPNLEGGQVRVSAGFGPGDSLHFSNTLGITGIYDSATGVLSLSGASSVANYQTALRSVTFDSTSDNPTASKTIEFKVNDGDVDSNAATKGIAVTATNDPPVVIATAGSLAYTENAAATAIDPGLTVVDPDDANLDGATVQITTACTDPEDVLALASPPAGITVSPYVPASCLLTLNGSASVANYQAALRAVTYANSSDDPDADVRTVTFTVDDGESTDSAMRDIAITPVNDAPIVVDRQHAVTGNIGISVALGTGLLQGVTDPEGDEFTAAVDASSAHHGDVVVNTDGSYTFNPRAGRQGIDTVIYEVCDDGTPSACSTADLDLTVADMIWFVDNSEVSAGDGRLSSPFNSLGALAAINNGVDTASSFHPAAGDTIFVYRDSATDYTGGLTLLASQKLVGAGATASLSTISGITPAADSVAALPATGGIRPNVLGGLVLGSGNTVRGLTLGNATTSLSGSSFGTLSLGSGGSADLAINTNGQAISLATGTVAGDLISVTSTGGTNNVALTTVSSTGTSLGTGALSGATGDSFAINGGTGSFSYSGSITTSAANSVDISNKTGGTVTLSGAITDTGAGIRLVSNGGATIALSGGVTVSSGANPAFTATGGGTFSVTGASNSLATTTGVALNVANTTIGASGLTFRSVSANGAPNGIVLNTTGSSGGLTITGTGTAGTGGTIQNISGSGNGISLTSTRDVSLSWMNILNTLGGNGISGTGVTNFSFVNGTVTNSGNGGSESNIAFNASPTGNNIAGTLTITGSTLTNAYYSGVDIQSGDGTVSNATISNNVITSSALIANSQGFGISIVGIGSASTSFNLTKATIATNTITNFPSAAGIQVSVSNTDATGPGATAGVPGSGTDIVAVNDNIIHGSSALVPLGTHGIAVVNGGGNSASRTRTNFIASGNNILHVAGTAILIGNNGYSTMTGDVLSNTIVANHTPNFIGANGIGGGNGVSGAGVAWTPDLTLTVSGNTISTTDGNGILLVGRGTSGTARFKIQNNTVAAPINVPLGAARQGIRIDAGNSAAGSDDTVCVNISGNTSAGSNTALGIGLRKQGTAVGTHDFGINGLSPSPATGIQAAAHVAGLNPLGGGVDIVSGDNFVSCSLP